MRQLAGIGRLPKQLALLLIVTCLTVWSYQPSLSGGFVFDDKTNLEDIQIDSNQSALDTVAQITLGNGSGPLGRPVSMLSFGAQMAATGHDPFPLKLGNLALHALNGLVLFFLARLIARRLDFDESAATWIAAVTAGLWLVHPMNLTAVAYIVQRMTSLSALFTALAILAYVYERSRQQLRPGRWFRLLALVGSLGLLGVFSKETGLLLPVYLLVAEVFILRFRAGNPTDIRATKALTVLIAGSMALTAALYFALTPNPFAGYAVRPFDLGERLLTEARVVAWYLRLLVVPDIQQMTLYHDGLPISTGLLSPPTTLLALAVLGGLVVAGVWLRRDAPWFGFGILFFLGGHLLESTVFPLELVYEHRNYLPSFGILFALTVGGALLLRRLAVAARLQAIIPVLLIGLLAVTTHTRAYQWSGDPAAPLLDALNHPESPRANIIAGNTYSLLAKGSKDAAERLGLIKLADAAFRQADELTPDSANALFGWLFLYYEHRLDPPDGLLDTLTARLKTTLVDASTVNGLHSLTTCAINGHCPLTDADFLAIMTAALENSRVTPSFKIPVLRDLARFHAEGQSDFSLAAAVSRRALELDRRSLAVHGELISYLANGGHTLAALDALRDFEQADRLGRYRSEIPRWRRVIEAGISSAAASP